MARLVVNPGTSEAWEVELSPGVYTLGRGNQNSLSIEHPSVSTSHCELHLSESGARLRDLGSTNGTFLEGELVEEAALRPGQTFRLGEVEMRIEPELSAGSVAAVPLALGAGQTVAEPAVGIARPASAAAQCKSHPLATARYVCPQCEEVFCDFCVRSGFARGSAVKYCRACGAVCERLPSGASAGAAAEVSFARRLAGAFLYPFNGDGLLLLGAGTVFLSVIRIISTMAGFAGFFGLVAVLMVGVFGSGYFVAYLKRILATSAAGEAAMPDWPDFSDLGADIVSPLLQFLGTALASFLPAVLLGMFVPDRAWGPLTVEAGLLFGCVYFPMAFLAVTIFDSVFAVNPLLILTSIARIPLHYLLTVALLGAVLALRRTADHLLQTLLPIPILPTAISSLLGLYLLTVDLRILGLLYLSKKDRLGWFRCH
jgi:FHA domain